MSATRAQSWTVVRQGVEWTINWARAKMLVLETILSLIYGVAHEYVVKKYPDNQTAYEFFESRTGLGERITNGCCDFLPVCIIMLNAHR